MTRTLASRIVGAVVCLFASSYLSGQDVPLTNWTVPPYRGASASGGMSTMVDVSPGTGFVGVAPCRLVDTRLASFPAGFGPPSLSQGVPRNFDLNSQPNCTGIPAGVEAYSLNITVTNTLGPGFILIYPQGGSQPPVSTLNYLANQTVANAAIVPSGTSGGVTVIAGVSGTNLIIDINGYFTDEYNPGVSFRAVSSTIVPAILAENTSALDDAEAIRGVITSTVGFNQAAIHGINRSLNDTGIGVWGSHEGSGIGVIGDSASWVGVVGQGAQGVWGFASSSDTDSAGVVGRASSLTGRVYGVQGLTVSTDFGAAAVYGRDGSVDPGPFFSPAGVRGASTSHFGVLGISKTVAVSGFRVTDVGQTVTAGELGRDATYGVYAVGNVGASGAKPFIEPHPTDPSKEIAYVALEGPEAGTYFRGKGRFQRGMAVISVPESFGMVTDSEGLSIQVMPIGEMATVAVVSLGLDRIVVKGSRDIEFFYTVNGVRKAFKDWEVIQSNTHYVPENPGARMPLAYAPEQRRRLIATGIYNADGTVNIETARRLGWDKEWEKRERPAPQPAE